MSGVKRVFVEKKKPFAVNAKELLEEIGGYLGIKTITDVRVLIRYDIENLSEETYKKALTTVFSEPPVDDVYEGTFPAGKDDFVFCEHSLRSAKVFNHLPRTSVTLTGLR